MINARVNRGFSDAELTANPEVKIIEKLLTCMFTAAINYIKVRERIDFM